MARKFDVAIALGWATPADKADALAQDKFWNDNRSELEKRYPGKYIAIVANNVFVGDTMSEVSAKANAAHPNRQCIIAATPPLIIDPINFHIGIK